MRENGPKLGFEVKLGKSSVDAWKLMGVDVHRLGTVDNHVWHVPEVPEP